MICLTNIDNTIQSNHSPVIKGADMNCQKVKISFSLSLLACLFCRSSATTGCGSSGVLITPTSSTGNMATFTSTIVALESYRVVSNHCISKTFI